MQVRSIKRRVAALAALAMLWGGGAARAADPQPSPVVWLKADAISGLKDGDSVAAWKDASGTGNDATQPQTDQQPTLVANAINGKPALHFESAMSTFLALKRPVQDDFTLFCVFRSTEGRDTSPNWEDGMGLVACNLPDVYHEYGLALNSLGQLQAAAGDPGKPLASGTGYNDGQAHVVTFQRLRRTGETALFVDGALAAHLTGSTTESLTAAPQLLIGGGHNDGRDLTGDIAELAIFDVALTPAQRQTAEQNLETKYGIAPGGISEGPATPIPAAQREQAIITAPDLKPTIHGPRVVGATPGRPFLFRLPVNGQEPLTYRATGLPAGLTLDPQTGIIAGTMAVPGTSSVQVAVSNTQGRATGTLTLVCGDHALARTPPLGWNSWNIEANMVTDADVREAADALVKTGLAAHGYQYVLIDDSWEGGRDLKGNILPNHRFPDMKALADYVHGKGLKLGIYSAGTEHTCSGFAGSAGYEALDAATYAGWGMDYVRDDWCPDDINRGSDNVADVKAAFGKMHDAMETTNRDMVFSVSTHGRDAVWDWAAGVGASTWSTTQSLMDTWESLSKGPFNQWNARDAGTGGWNDMGLLMIGRLGYGNLHRSTLTASEQMVQLSLWSLRASPLMLSCDLTTLDPSAFHPSTTALLTNDEVLDVDQDALGKIAWPVVDQHHSQYEVWARPLADGTQAVGLFNLLDRPLDIRVPWSALKLTGPQPVRDLWLHQDLGTFATGVATEVPAHGVALLKVGASAPTPPSAPLPP